MEITIALFVIVFLLAIQRLRERSIVNKLTKTFEVQSGEITDNNYQEVLSILSGHGIHLSYAQPLVYDRQYLIVGDSVSVISATVLSKEHLTKEKILDDFVKQKKANKDLLFNIGVDMIKDKYIVWCVEEGGTRQFSYDNMLLHNSVSIGDTIHLTVVNSSKNSKILSVTYAAKETDGKS